MSGPRFHLRGIHIVADNDNDRMVTIVDILNELHLRLLALEGRFEMEDERARAKERGGE